MKPGMKPAIDTRDLRNVLGVFATGVTVVTTRDDDDRPRGFTANSFTSVSLDPPLILVCVARNIGAAPAFIDTRHFAVNILSAGQQSVSTAFGTRAGTKFEAVSYTNGGAGSPIIEGVAAWLECETHDTVEQGDHVILVGRVLDYAYSTANPLGYCRGAYVTFGLAQDALNAAQASGPVRVGAIIEHDGTIYLEPDGNGRVGLPSARRLGSADDPGTLVGRLSAAGVRMELSFIYAVFDDSEQGVQYIFYRAEARKPDASLRDRFVAFDAIPWPRLPDDAIRTMLRRYVTERQENVFGIYMGDHRSGTVRALSERVGGA
jgi:flavin reductase (DIM6/NTAB) family NADH-FMN oxidoreductase RutF